MEREWSETFLLVATTSARDVHGELVILFGSAHSTKINCRDRNEMIMKY